ncbi:MOSC domain-containing protein [Pseudovibrio sp. SPO723]|uniref:MOSC domain-containing protein n=1 Tax=Nesiotobacter zosterae TaxID=392721 RepID=UPI0029C33BC8|nr:MOSC domain-containing protein [Pseudovibrio sp. SPO723]MDX5593268.1 MOSC domain-containing protein [Pseudovibrio sp. SPO723]
MRVSGEIIGLYVGKAEKLWPEKAASAIRKIRQDGLLELNALGFLEDEQADLEVHGGPEKALHHYAAEHYARWAEEFPEHAALFKPGAVGENISTTGLTESNLCLGDVFSLGSARVQICQGRQPCWKLVSHTGIASMAMRFQKTGFTGWYYRVLEGGSVRAGDTMSLLDRPHEDLVLADVIAARFNPRLDPALAQKLADTAVLSESWRKAFLKKSNAGFKEDTSKRLNG